VVDLLVPLHTDIHWMFAGVAGNQPPYCSIAFEFQTTIVQHSAILQKMVITR
jgi:hypothetical protein